MVDWTSDASMEKQGLVLSKIDLIIFGIFLWECIVTLRFDIDILTRKRPFKWPIAAYWLTKYSTLVFVSTINVFNNTGGFLITKQFLHCQTLANVINVTARFAIAGASGLLMLRAIALWNRDLRVAIPLIILHLAQWGLYLHNAFTITNVWSEELQICITTSLTLPWLKAQFIYTMIFDGFVLIAASWALFRLPGRANLMKMLFFDGLVYYIGVFLMYFACTLVAYLGPSPFFMFIFSDLATVLVSILAGRSFVRIATYSYRQDGGSSGGQPAHSGVAIAFAGPATSAPNGRFTGRWNTTSKRTQNIEGERGMSRGMGNSHKDSNISIEMIPVSLPNMKGDSESDIEAHSHKA